MASKKLENAWAQKCAINDRLIDSRINNAIFEKIKLFLAAIFGSENKFGLHKSEKHLAKLKL